MQKSRSYEWPTCDEPAPDIGAQEGDVDPNRSLAAEPRVRGRIIPFDDRPDRESGGNAEAFKKEMDR